MHRKIKTKTTCTQNISQFCIVLDPDVCPVKTFELYKLNPEVDILWQCPKAKLFDVSGPWYDVAPVG